MTTRYLACDLGAESGGLMLGTLADGRLALEELHRFPNGPVRMEGELHWDISRLFGELKAGLLKAASRALPISSISADSWGVDYLLFDAAGQDWDYVTLEHMAADAPALVSLIDPNEARFLAPDQMPEKVAAFCRETGQPVPEGPGPTIRCVCESLALLYRRTLRQLEELAGHKMRCLHIVGGGSRNDLLNQFAADALQIPILAGPREATAIGNLLAQALALGHVPSLAAARQIVRDSFDVQTVAPRDGQAWDGAQARFEALTCPSPRTGH